MLARAILVEEVDPGGFTCFENTDETLFRGWLKIDPE
jgi:hypothetical protein